MRCGTENYDRRTNSFDQRIPTKGGPYYGHPGIVEQVDITHWQPHCHTPFLVNLSIVLIPYTD